MARSGHENTVTGQNRVVRKKGDLTGSGKGDWLRIDVRVQKYKKIFNERNAVVSIFIIHIDLIFQEQS